MLGTLLRGLQVNLDFTSLLVTLETCLQATSEFIDLVGILKSRFQETLDLKGLLETQISLQVTLDFKSLLET